MRFIPRKFPQNPKVDQPLVNNGPFIPFLPNMFLLLNEDIDDEGKLRGIYPDNSEEGGLIEQWIYGKIFECYHYTQQNKLH